MTEKAQELMCVECSHPVPELFNNTSTPGNIKLYICENCHSLADKYVEYDTVLISLDLILHRVGVYRHILFNLPKSQLFGISYLRLLIAIILLVTYSKLYLLDQNAPLSNPRTNIHLFVSTCVEFIGYTFTIALAAMIWKREYSKQILLDMLTLVTLSSFGYLFSILIIVWKYPIHFLSILQCFGFTSTCVALLAYLRCSPVLSTLIVSLASVIEFIVYLICVWLGFQNTHLMTSTGLFGAPSVAQL